MAPSEQKMQPLLSRQVWWTDGWRIGGNWPNSTRHPDGEWSDEVSDTPNTKAFDALLICVMEQHTVMDKEKNLLLLKPYQSDLPDREDDTLLSHECFMNSQDLHY